MLLFESKYACCVDDNHDHLYDQANVLEYHSNGVRDGIGLFELSRILL